MLKMQSSSNFAIAAYTVYLQEMSVLGQMTMFDKQLQRQWQ